MKNKSFASETEISKSLEEMENDPIYRTKPGYVRDTPTSEKYLVSFSKKHLIYLQKHPKLNPEHYLANLRTMLKIRP